MSTRLCLPKDLRVSMYHLEKVLIDYSAYIPEGKALDMGCGYGRHSLCLARKGFYVEEISLSEESVAGCTWM
jgi:tellurite methyltransferase